VAALLGDRGALAENARCVAAMAFDEFSGGKFGEAWPHGSRW